MLSKSFWKNRQPYFLNESLYQAGDLGNKNKSLFQETEVVFTSKFVFKLLLYIFITDFYIALCTYYMYMLPQA